MPDEEGFISSWIPITQPFGSNDQSDGVINGARRRRARHANIRGPETAYLAGTTRNVMTEYVPVVIYIDNWSSGSYMLCEPYVF